MRLITTLLLICTSILSISQTKKHAIYFTDKVNSPFTLVNPIEYLSQRAIDRRINQNIAVMERDFPVDTVYTDSLTNLGANVVYTSKWLNAALVEADSATMFQINNLSFVLNTDVLERPTSTINEDKLYYESVKPIYNSKSGQGGAYGVSKTQNFMLSTEVMHTSGFKGEGMVIAVLDNGFSGVDIVNGFSSLRDEGRILSTYDFVENEENVFDDGSHGTMVLSTIAGELDQEYLGSAYEASFHLFVSENTSAELLDEEFYWVVAAERADSLGVDLINTSLGYSTFDNSNLNHTYSDLDGNTTVISKGSEIAASTGMLLITSAGNSGASFWHYITAPGDADNIITVGAVNSNYVKTSFSSVGPTADGRIKPDLCALGEGAAIIESNGQVSFGNGTSFSSPLLCGLAAGFWQAHPELTNQEVIKYLRQSATQSTVPDTLQGWGVPNFKDAHVLAGGVLTFDEKIESDIEIYPNPLKSNKILNINSKNEVVDFQISNVIGEIIMIEKKKSINLNELSSGIYFAKVTLVNGKSKTFKIQIEF